MDRASFTGQGLHVMAKPIGPICNLDCEYCYYLHKQDLYPNRVSWRMPERTLETYIEQYIAAQPESACEITFAWQGGEPTLLGVEFFERVVELQLKHSRKGKRIVNALQTNGVLVDADWCQFFRDNEFLIGLSIDGPAELHDRYRYDKKGRPTFLAVLRCLKLFKEHRVEFNALVVVNSHNAAHGRRVYTYLRDNGVKFIQFIPIVERRGVGVHPEELLRDLDSRSEWDQLVSTRSVHPEQFGDFLIEVFNEWIRRDVGKIFVQIFDQALSAWMGLEPSLCVFRKECGRALAIEHNGDVFCCDHYVEEDYKLGNILELPIVELANSETQFQFGRDKASKLPNYCRDCEVRFACNGECPKNRFITTPDGDEGLNYLCQGYRRFFNHIDPIMKLMADELRNNRPAANVMHRLNAQRRGKKEESKHPKENNLAANRLRTDALAGPNIQPRRNDLCPCGSGKKFKKCCMRGSALA